MAIDVDAVLGAKFEDTRASWTQKDVILYALGLGVGVGQSPVDEKVLQYTYEKDLKVVPTFGVVPVFSCLTDVLSIPGFDVNPMMILHGEQYTEVLCDDIPIEATVVNSARATNVFDKGKGALVTIESETRTEDGQALFKNVFSIFVRGEGGFGGESGPPVANEAPARKPDASIEYPTLEHQAIIYRLSGDYNPLHIDPEMAAFGGFDRPILHGLCTFGNVGRGVVEAMCDNDPKRFRSIQARFASPVIPGETIVINMWKESDTDVIVEARVKERDTAVVKNTKVVIKA